jgi:hypothetical protein
MKESLLVVDGCLAGCLEDEVENGSSSELTREHQASHAAQYGNFGKHHVIQYFKFTGALVSNAPYDLKILTPITGYLTALRDNL